MSGTIAVKEEKSQKWVWYDNENSETVISYYVRRDPVTNKFQKLTIGYTFVDIVAKGFYGCISIPEYDIFIISELSWNEGDEDHSPFWKLEMNLDLNNKIPDDVKDVVIKLCTESE